MISSWRNYLRLGIVLALAGCSTPENHDSASTSSVQADASAPWAKEIYPDDQFAQNVLASLVNIMKHHETQDPFKGGHGPGFEGFGMNRAPMGFYVSTDDASTDLLIINWKGQVPTEFKAEQALTAAIGLPVFRVSSLSIKALSTQGDDGGAATSFFSYLFGSEQSGYEGPDYLPKEHFLRKALGNRMMPLCAPLTKWLEGQELPFGKDRFLIVMNTMVHETYHIIENNARTDAQQNTINGNRHKMLAAIETPAFAKALVVYYKTVVQLMSSVTLPLPAGTLSKPEVRQALGMVVAAAKDVRAMNSAAFDGFAFEEYSEGFAEYVASQTLLEMGIYTYKTILKRHEDSANPNPIFYRAGALGGLMMRATVGNFDWQVAAGYDSLGIWEKLGEALKDDLDLPSADTFGSFSKTVTEVEVTKEIEKIKKYYE